ncbi:hypothetical protein PAALTS15_19858 [Paenibacillus alvei TS-15]|uniref:Uncharacterized protein n=1 Tax=Paenibacillus alvei TS-15 TaxID=1117108 RepID=S9U4N8_PAEAL|nr:hypothetical protein PAALTS15_19858 [Paenibacillus alvei TS-15]
MSRMDWISEPLSVTMERGKRKKELEGRIAFQSGIIYIRKLEQCGRYKWLQADYSYFHEHYTQKCR